MKNDDIIDCRMRTDETDSNMKTYDITDSHMRNDDITDSHMRTYDIIDGHVRRCDITASPAGSDDIKASLRETEMVESLSEVSSQGIESDFNLMITESDSASDDLVCVTVGGGRGEAVERGGGLCEGVTSSVTLRKVESEERREEREEEEEDMGLEQGNSETVGGVMNKREGREDGEIRIDPKVIKKCSSGVPEMILSSADSTTTVTVTTRPPQKASPATLTGSRLVQYCRNPPTRERLRETAALYGLPSAVNLEPFFSNPADVQPAR